MLEVIFKTLCAGYSDDAALIGQQWSGITEAYGEPGRYYHNLHHLEHCYQSLLPLKESLIHWDETLFSLFYHDLVYNPLKKDNEEQSAIKARQAMNALDVPSVKIEFTSLQILCTKKHALHQEEDINYFTDADLAILGQEWPVYHKYALNVRKEYSMYPDLMYNPGRKKVLVHFLSMERIFKTDFFYCKLESTARNNLQMELKLFNQ